MTKEQKALMRWAESRGWQQTRRRAHIQLTHPVAGLYHVSANCSDHRGPLNAKKDMERLMRNPGKATSGRISRGSPSH
jgi:hypothetical protein